MKKIILFSLVVLLFACHNEPDTCLVNNCLVVNPVNELDWLKKEIEVLKNSDKNSSLEMSKYFFVSIALFDKTTVFFTNNCCPFCSTLPPILKNCSGEPIGYIYETVGTMNYQGITIESVNRNQLKDIKIIWKPENFACQVN